MRVQTIHEAEAKKHAEEVQKKHIAEVEHAKKLLAEELAHEAEVKRMDIEKERVRQQELIKQKALEAKKRQEDEDNATRAYHQQMVTKKQNAEKQLILKKQQEEK